MMRGSMAAIFFKCHGIDRFAQCFSLQLTIFCNLLKTDQNIALFLQITLWEVFDFFSHSGGRGGGGFCVHPKLKSVGNPEVGNPNIHRIICITNIVGFDLVWFDLFGFHVLVASHSMVTHLTVSHL